MKRYIVPITESHLPITMGSVLMASGGGGGVTPPGFPPEEGMPEPVSRRLLK